MFSNKKLVALVLFMLLLPTLAACGGDTGTPVPAGTGTSEAAPTPGTDGGTQTTPTGAAGEPESTPAGGDTGTSGDVFRWRAFTEPASFDPALMQEFVSIDLGQNLYEGLTRFNPETLKIEPGIAESWSVNPDATVYTFKLNKNARFSNGDPVTAEDFKWSWNRALNTANAPYLFVMDDIKGAREVQASVASTDTTKPKVTEAEGIKVVDPQTLEVTLNNASAYFLPQTAVWTYYVLNKNVVGKCPTDQPSCFAETGQHVGAGSGPYILESWDHEQRLRLKVNENYWNPDEKAVVDVEVPIVTDTATAQAQYENGQLDALDGPSPADLERLQNDANFKDQLHSVGQARSVWIGLNVMKPPFGPLDDPKAKALREALNMAFDREQLIEIALAGAGAPLTTLMPEGEPGFKKIEPFQFDPEAAKAKLAEAGYPNCQGLDLTYTTRDREVEQAVATQIQTQMKENLGCDIKVDVVAWSDMLAARQAHEYTMFYGSWGHDYPDPQNWLYALFHSDQIQGVGPGSGNDPGYSNPEYDKLVSDANKLADPARIEERYQLYQQAEEILLKDAPLVPLYQATRYWLASPRWEGYGTNNTFIYPFNRIRPAQ
jgi:ABC-type transport system substrate-binding protein